MLTKNNLRFPMILQYFDYVSFDFHPFTLNAIQFYSFNFIPFNLALIIFILNFSLIMIGIDYQVSFLFPFVSQIRFLKFD